MNLFKPLSCHLLSLGLVMRRREFITLLGGAAVCPLAVRAQSVDKMRRVGVLPTGYRKTDPEGQARVAAFLDTLGKLGWNDGRNVRLEVRWPGNEIEQIREETTALVGSAPDVIVISSNAALAVLQKLDKTTPTVFVQVSDPVGSGFVSSLSRPDGNVTGFQNFEPAMGGKWLGLLKEVAPAHSGSGAHVSRHGGPFRIPARGRSGCAIARRSSVCDQRPRW
jgi:putative tryptophan/tyrosine transport system substrate-binding protein